MTSIAKLKDKARKHEQKEDWQAAIAAYRQVLDKQADEESLDLDLGLFNRIGDLNLRIGRVDDAVEYYERAADKYAEQGLYNNAIALCNKALRHRPNRAPIYLKLSRLCSEQGFETDARRWILEYAERQVAAGAVEAALTGLEEFAELSDDPEVRELLAQQLVTHGREDEALEQLRAAYRMRVLAGDREAAAAVATRAKEIDTGVDLEAEPAPEPSTDAEEGSAIPTLEPAAERVEEAGAATPEASSGEDEAGEVGITGSLETTATEATGEASPPDTLEGLETRPDAVEDGAVEGIEGLESTAETAGVEEATGPGAGAGEVTGLEVSHGERAAAEAEEPEPDTLGGLETFDTGAPGEPDGEVEEEEAEPLPLLDESYEEDELVPEAGGDADLNIGELAAAEPEEEAPEPLPELEGGFEAAEEAAEAGTEPVELEPTAEIESPVESAEPSSAGGVEAPEEVREPEEATEAGEAGVDLETFDLGFETVRAKAPPVSVEDLDVEAIISRARQQVSRGLADEALRELHLLSGSDADPEVFRAALGVADEIVRTHDDHVAAMQHRVEYAARIGDRDLLVDRYLDLAETLERIGSETRARAMYDRVLDLDPDNERARKGRGAGVEGADEAGEEKAVDLDAVLREMDPDELEAAVGGDESDASFAAMLDRFKAKVTKATDQGDAGDHYDLGLAFKEMGLIDEAIAEFQTALTGGEEQLKVYEELGQCFVMQGQYNVALKVFNRALQVPGAEPEELLGVYYHLGQCYEELGQRQEAREAYERVLAIDQTFADVPDRMARL